MFDDYELYHGVVLRQIVIGAPYGARIKPFEREGRINAYAINGRIGLFIKHSSKRITPWPFTFHLDQVSDLLDLEATYPQTFIAFVCGTDGLVVLDVATLHQLVSFQESETAWIRVSRKPRSMYSVAGNNAELPNKVARGTGILLDAVQKSRT
jgi:hypothetical protein